MIAIFRFRKALYALEKHAKMIAAKIVCKPDTTGTLSACARSDERRVVHIEYDAQSVRVIAVCIGKERYNEQLLRKERDALFEGWQSAVENFLLGGNSDGTWLHDAKVVPKIPERVYVLLKKALKKKQVVDAL